MTTLVLSTVVHGCTLPTPLPVDVNDIATVSRSCGNRGLVTMVDGTWFEVTNVDAIVEALMMDVECES